MVTDFSGQMDYCEVQQLFDTVIPFGQHRCYWKSHYLGGLSDEVIDLVVEWNIRSPSPSTLSSLWNFGGATAAVGADDTAFGDRSMPWMVSINSIWNVQADDTTNITWTRDLWERLTPFAARSPVPELRGTWRGQRGAGASLLRCQLRPARDGQAQI